MTSITINSLDNLKSILLAHDVDISKYGHGHGRDLGQLHWEIKQGSSYLSIVDGKLIRTSTSLVVLIKRSNGQVLVEVNHRYHKTPQRDEHDIPRNVMLVDRIYAYETISEATR